MLCIFRPCIGWLKYLWLWSLCTLSFGCPKRLVETFYVLFSNFIYPIRALPSVRIYLPYIVLFNWIFVAHFDPGYIFMLLLYANALTGLVWWIMYRAYCYTRDANKQFMADDFNMTKVWIRTCINIYDR